MPDEHPPAGLSAVAGMWRVRGSKSSGSGCRETKEYSVLLAHRYTPRSPTWQVARKSSVGDMLSDVTAESTAKQSINLPGMMQNSMSEGKISSFTNSLKCTPNLIFC